MHYFQFETVQAGPVVGQPKTEDKTPAIDESQADTSDIEEISGSVTTENKRRKRGILDTGNKLIDKLSSMYNCNTSKCVSCVPVISLSIYLTIKLLPRLSGLNNK